MGLNVCDGGIEAKGFFNTGQVSSSVFESWQMNKEHLLPTILLPVCENPAEVLFGDLQFST